MQRTLYGYWRSSASYRVRIALNLKGLDYQHAGIHLVDGEQRSPAFLARNPQGFVPLYSETQAGETVSLSQSLAIMDYLDARYTDVPLLPNDMARSAQLKSLSQIIACDIHPLDNLRVLTYLTQTLHVADSAKMTWYRHWITEGFNAIEAQLPQLLDGQLFSLGERPGYFEAVLVPQVYNAKRFDCALDAYPTIQVLSARCDELPAFQAAAPENQPDAV